MKIKAVKGCIGAITVSLLWVEAARAGSISVTTLADRVAECSDLRFSLEGREAATTHEEFTISRGEATGLRARLPENAGAYVRGSDRGDFSVTVCKAAASGPALEAIFASFSGGEVILRGPKGEDWTAYLLVRAPRNASIQLEARNGPLDLADLSGPLDVQASNGPISIENSSGSIQARATNGPISLSGCSGEGQARAQNGPIHFEGDRGRFRLSTRNGPIGVELTGASWEEGDLEARAVNGPLSLRIPDGFRSGAVVEASDHTPMRCRAPACAAARKSWDETSRRIEFGDSPVVRLSTINGPVTIEAPGTDEEE
jgi:hypothetical protein